MRAPDCEPEEEVSMRWWGNAVLILVIVALVATGVEAAPKTAIIEVQGMVCSG